MHNEIIFREKKYSRLLGQGQQSTLRRGPRDEQVYNCSHTDFEPWEHSSKRTAEDDQDRPKQRRYYIAKVSSRETTIADPEV